jgi:hypothetical protein
MALSKSFRKEWMRWRTFERLTAQRNDLFDRSMLQVMLKFRLGGEFGGCPTQIHLDA